MNKNNNANTSDTERNLCSIFHARFKHLVKVIKNPRKAQLVDYILLGWQSSTYKLKNSDKKWFMKPYTEIASDTGIPKSTLERYIKELEEDGFIERRQALYSRTDVNGEFAVKKGAYINITQQLLDSLKPPAADTKDMNDGPDDDINKNTPHPQGEPPAIQGKNQPDCSAFNNNEGIENPKTRGSYIRDLFPSSLNHIILKRSNASVDKSNYRRLRSQFASMRQFLFSDIKEEIPEEIKKQVAGTFSNLTFKNKLLFSSPKQIVAEYLFALLNVEFYMPHTQCLKHRNNVLSKIMRAGDWRTPKGFYNHFYLGQSFKDRQLLREQQWQEEKEAEINPSRSVDSGMYSKNEDLVKLEAKIHEKGNLIEQLMHQIYQESSEEIIFQLREKIQMLRKEMDILWHEQLLIEQAIEGTRFIDTPSLCA